VFLNDSPSTDESFFNKAFSSTTGKHPKSTNIKFFETDVSNYALKY